MPLAVFAPAIPGSERPQTIGKDASRKTNQKQILSRLGELIIIIIIIIIMSVKG